jgi:hypothetical protein
MTDSDGIKAIRKRLNRLSCLQTAPQLSADEATAIRQDLAVFNQLSEYQTLGVCADSLEQGKGALLAFLQALGVNKTLDLPPREGPVYIKFNTLKGAWYLDDYSGPSRGVLVTFHTEDEAVADLIGTYGPFPLDLYADG